MLTAGTGAAHHDEVIAVDGGQVAGGEAGRVGVRAVPASDGVAGAFQQAHEGGIREVVTSGTRKAQRHGVADPENACGLGRHGCGGQCECGAGRGDEFVLSRGDEVGWGVEWFAWLSGVE